jgi:Rrf2 family protein
VDKEIRQTMFAKTSQYALRLMVCVAKYTADAPVRSAELSELSCVPRAYVSKVMRRLEDAGLVGSRKGRGGGFWLARPPEFIPLRDVLAAVEEHAVASHDCVFGWGPCNSASPCPLHETWKSLETDVSTWTHQTLGDVIDGRG